MRSYYLPAIAFDATDQALAVVIDFYKWSLAVRAIAGIHILPSTGCLSGEDI
jgi:hypothetical protein